MAYVSQLQHQGVVGMDLHVCVCMHVGIVD